MARGKLNVMPMSADDKPRVLHKLQGSIHFEKTLPETAAANSAKRRLGLTIPSWFVQKHGDKFREFSILRTESSTERWPVKLSISVSPPTLKTRVRFLGGWQAFANCNDLLKGDSLIFVLMAMAEFKVYAFRSTGPCKFPNPKRRRWACDTDHSQKKAKRPYHKCRDALLRAEEEGNLEGKIGSNTESSAVSDGAIAPTPQPTCKEDSSHQLPSFWKSFWKTLTATNVGQCEKAYLEIPRSFCKKYGNRIRSVVKLQGIYEKSPERTVTCHTSFGKKIRHHLNSEWQDFVTENRLYEGQELLFTLSADSFFVVRERMQYITNWA